MGNGKKDNFMNAYKIIYDKNDKILSEIDSTEYSLGTKNYYYERDDVNIISEKFIF